MDGKSKIIKCKCEGLEAKGAYELSGPYLLVRSTLGDFKTIAGLRNPRRTARTLLRNVCAAAAKKQRTEVAKVRPAVVIEAVQDAPSNAVVAETSDA